MIIRLSSDREQLILSLLKAGKFPSADAIIDEALRLVGQLFEDLNEPMTTDQADDSGERTAERLENLKTLGRKLDAMPAADADDPVPDPILGLMRDDAGLMDEIVADAYRHRREETWREVEL